MRFISPDTRNSIKMRHSFRGSIEMHTSITIIKKKKNDCEMVPEYLHHCMAAIALHPSVFISGITTVRVTVLALGIFLFFFFLAKLVTPF